MNSAVVGQRNHGSCQITMPSPQDVGQSGVLILHLGNGLDISFSPCLCFASDQNALTWHENVAYFNLLPKISRFRPLTPL